MTNGEIAESLRRSTVLIKTGAGRRGHAGSGVVWSRDGCVLTNAHVVRGGGVEVELWDGRSSQGAIEARDDRRDLAKLRLPFGDLPAVSVREGPVRTGELVVASGNPLGFVGAISTGIVHSIGAIRGLSRAPWIQSTVRLAPGNSGGPLADAEGRLIGINTMVLPGGIGLAIPVALIREFERHGAAPLLGVTVQPVRVRSHGAVGLLVLSVAPGTPAERASLLIGDLLIGANGAPFQTPSDLSDTIDAANGGTLRLAFLRGNRDRSREVAIAFPQREAS